MSIPTNLNIKNVLYNETSIPLVSGIPIECSTEAAMLAALTSANVGRCYVFTGATTSNFVNGDMYVVEEV